MKSLGYGVVLAAFAISFVANAAEPTGRYKQIVDGMKKLNEAYPTISHIYSIGKNDDDVEIMAMRISVTPTKMDPAKIGQLVVGTHHGNESHAATFSMAFMKKTLERYETSEVYRGNLADMEWTIVPVLNVSGYNANNRYEHGRDPNRDYPGPCIKATGGKLKSIALIMEAMKQRAYTGSLTVHGYVGTLTYPWGIDVKDDHTQDHNLFEQMTAKAAKLNGYRYGTSTEVVYPCDGTFEDYTYWKHGMWSLLLELRDGSEDDITRTVDSMVLYFDQLNSSPSVKNQLTSNCQRSGRLDLGIE